MKKCWWLEPESLTANYCWYLLIHFPHHYHFHHSINIQVYIRFTIHFPLTVTLCLTSHIRMSDIHVQHVHTSQCKCNPLPIHYKNAAHTSPRQWYCLDNQLYPSLASYPDPPSTFQEEKYGEYSTTFLYLQGILVAQSDWLIWQLFHLYWLPYHKIFSFTHHTSTDLHSTPSNLLKPSKWLQSLALAGSTATASGYGWT